MQAKNGLINKRVKIQISEPWNFELPGRGNIIEGVIEGVCRAPKEKDWENEDLLISVIKPFMWKDDEIKQLLVSPRFMNEEISDILENKSVTVGILRVKPKYFLSPSIQFDTTQVEYFAIGSASLVKEYKGREQK